MTKPKKKNKSARPQNVSPCEWCKIAKTCNQICIERARWWDKSMEKIRRNLNDEKK